MSGSIFEPKKNTNDKQNYCSKPQVSPKNFLHILPLQLYAVLGVILKKNEDHQKK
tara:strand:- start:1178 stop:1342 length:165 start_codon:yes stop_codon:yes gene_type:complete